jgi:hypothetical protein
MMSEHKKKFLTAVFLVVVHLCAAAGAEDRLSTIWLNEGPLVFAAAGSTNDAFRSLSERALGSDWKSWCFVHLVPRLDPVVLDQELKELRTGLGAMTTEQQASAQYQIELWIMCYRSLDALENIAGPEAFGSAVALVPAVAAEFPRDRKMIEKLGKNAGETLASAEFCELAYNVATCLTQMEELEIATTIRDLWIAAIDSREGP